MSEITRLQDDLQAFASARDWDQFHSPKNLAASIAIEAGELLELFQWRDPATEALTDKDRERLADELADVLIYLVRLADVTGIDIVAAAHDKVAKNAAKYPVHKSRGNAKKYTEFD